jgi:hypothetical protein
MVALKKAFVVFFSENFVLLVFLFVPLMLRCLHTALPPALQLMKFDDTAMHSPDEGVRRTLSQESEEADTNETKRPLSAVRSDPYSSASDRNDSDSLPTGHVRVKAKYDAPDLQAEPGRVVGRRAARTDAPTAQQVDEPQIDSQDRFLEELPSSPVYVARVSQLVCFYTISFNSLQAIAFCHSIFLVIFMLLVKSAKSFEVSNYLLSTSYLSKLNSVKLGLGIVKTCLKRAGVEVAFVY